VNRAAGRPIYPQGNRRRQDVNRPLYAFAALAGMLVMAMVAVGLASRPVSQPSGTAPVELARSGVGSGAYLLVLQDPDFADADAAEPTCCRDLGPCDLPAYAAGCGLDRTTGMVYPVSTMFPKVDLQTIVVRVAERPAVEAAADATDCLSHYDPAYDAAVYGTTPDRRRPVGGKIEAADPILLLFNSLLETRSQPAAALPPNSAASRWQYQLRAMAAGLGNHLRSAALELGLDDEWQSIRGWLRLPGSRRHAVSSNPSWADYEAWIASLQPRVAPWSTPAGGADGSGALSRRELLQFAVAGLNHAAKTLSGLADLLESAAGGEPSQQLGVRGTQLQPR
jgi:hypothetical protein